MVVQQQVPVAAGSTPMAVVPLVDKNLNFADWDKKITESGKFMVGPKTAFNSKPSRNKYIRLLMNGFIALPEFEDVSFDKLFDPLHGYANFQTLLNMVPVPADHEGFYKRDSKKAHLTSSFLTSPQ